MGSSVETELKLRLPPGASIVRAAPLRFLNARTARLEAIYFDTADSLLQRHGMALRLRREGDRWAQTLKRAKPGQGGLSARAEWEEPASMRGGVPRVDLARLRASPLPALLKQHSATRSLVEVFRTRCTRTVWEVDFRKSRIEVALDRGRIEVRRGSRVVAEPISELELELKSGRADDLIALALRLTGRGARARALVPLVRSKAERGYGLAARTAPAVAKASARGFVEPLRADFPSGVALRAVMAHGVHVLLANAEGARESRDPEFVHQARVAIRRMRSALRLLDRRHNDFPSKLAAELRWIGQCLGRARDWDVFEDSTLPSLLDQVPRQLRVRAVRCRAQANRGALAALASPRFARLALQLQGWTLTPPPPGRSLRRRAAATLARAHTRLFDAARFFAALSPERRHRVRVLAKRLRYALDLFAVALPAKPTRHYVTALANLQDDLGALNDVAVARRLLAELEAGPAVVGAVAARLDAVEQEESRTAGGRLLALAGLERPWAAKS